MSKRCSMKVATHSTSSSRPSCHTRCSERWGWSLPRWRRWRWNCWQHPIWPRVKVVSIPLKRQRAHAASTWNGRCFSGPTWRSSMASSTGHTPIPKPLRSQRNAMRRGANYGCSSIHIWTGESLTTISRLAGTTNCTFTTCHFITSNTAWRSLARYKCGLTHCTIRNRRSQTIVAHWHWAQR